MDMDAAKTGGLPPCCCCRRRPATGAAGRCWECSGGGVVYEPSLADREAAAREQEDLPEW